MSPTPKGFAVATADFSQLTAVIPTADRPKCLRRVVRSLRRHCPELKVLVGDYGLEPVSASGEDHLRLPTGVGRGGACNALLARLRTRYFLMLGDSCELQKETRIERLLELVASDKLDLAAGSLTGCARRFWIMVRRTPEQAHGLLEFEGERLSLTRGHRSAGDGFLWCDLVHSFYVARTDKIRQLGGWDPELMQDEREEFFVRAQRQGIRVGLAPEVSALRWHSPSPEEATSRKSLAVAKMGISYMTDFEGMVTKAPRRAMAA